MGLFILLIAFAAAWTLQFMFAAYMGRKVSYTQFNACGLLTLTGSADDCTNGVGGIAKSYVADFKDLDVDAATFDLKGFLVDIPWLTPSTPYVELVPDDNDQAFFNQEGARDDNGKYTNTSTGNYTFTGVNATKYEAAEKLIDCCALVVVHEWNNGFVTVQGVKSVKQTDGSYKLKRTKRAAKAIPSVLSDTAADGANDRIGLTIVSSDSKLACILTPGQASPSPVIPAATIADLVTTD
jgi:hypothetical protein